MYVAKHIVRQNLQPVDYRKLHTNGKQWFFFHFRAKIDPHACRSSSMNITDLLRVLDEVQRQTCHTMAKLKGPRPRVFDPGKSVKQ